MFYTIHSNFAGLSIKIKCHLHLSLREFGGNFIFRHPELEFSDKKYSDQLII